MTATGKIIEIKDREQFEELQNKFLDLKGQYIQTSQMVEILGREKRRNELTMEQIEETPQNCKLYQQVGRMFLQTPRTTVEKDLKNQILKNEKEQKEYETKRTYLQNRLDQTSQAMQELITEKSK